MQMTKQFKPPRPELAVYKTRDCIFREDIPVSNLETLLESATAQGPVASFGKRGTLYGLEKATLSPDKYDGYTGNKFELAFEEENT